MGLVGSHQVGTLVDPVNNTSPIDADEVRTNDNTLSAALDAHDADATIHLQTGAHGSRPAAGTAGRCWFSTDTQRLYYDNGSTWLDLAALATALSGVVAVANGGTGLSGTPSNGQLPIGNGTGYTLAQLTAGVNITIVNTAGGIEIRASGTVSDRALNATRLFERTHLQ